MNNSSRKILFMALLSIQAVSSAIAQTLWQRDSTFSNNAMGFIQPPFAPGVLFQLPDKKLLVAGSGNIQNSPQQYFFIAKYNYDGSPDSSFAQNGIYQLAQPYVNGVPVNITPLTMYLDASERIIVISRQYNATTGNKFHAVRLFANGLSDNSFGINGEATYSLTGADPLSNPKNIIRHSDSYFALFAAGIHNGIYLSRLNSDFLPDSAFGNHSLVSVAPNFPFSGFNTHGMRASVTGEIFVYGSVEIQTGPNNYLIIKFLADGSLDTTFGNGGIAADNIQHEWDTNGNVTASFDNISSLHIQNDGKIIWTGSSDIYYPGGFNQEKSTVIVRLSPQGFFDTAFGNNGWVKTDSWSNYGKSVFISALQQLSDESILIAGTSSTYSQSYLTNTFTFVKRYYSDGTTDSVFVKDFTHGGSGGGPGNSLTSFLLESDSIFYITGSLTHIPLLAKYHIENTLSGIESRPGQTSLLNIFPNPAERNFSVSYSLQETDLLNISLFDISGKLQTILYHVIQGPGKHQLEFALPENLPQGTYMLSIKTDEGIAMKKFVKM